MNNAQIPKDGVYFVCFYNDAFKYRAEKIKGIWYLSDGTGWTAVIEYPEGITTVEFVSDLPDLPEIKKPPHGVMPRNTWEEDRQLNLLAAMARYVEEGFKIPPEWIDELNDLNERDK